MTLDMSKYLGLFVSEATEHLEALGSDLGQAGAGERRRTRWTRCSATRTR